MACRGTLPSSTDYGIYLLRELRFIDRADKSILAMLKRFAVTSRTDNDNGHYEINYVGMFVIGTIPLLAGIWRALQLILQVEGSTGRGFFRFLTFPA